MASLPSWGTLGDEYLDYRNWSSPAVRREIGGSVDKDYLRNTCAIRMSWMLNYIGMELDRGPDWASRKKGVLGFAIRYFSDATGHFDLWNGKQFTNEYAVAKNYWNLADRIWLWAAAGFRGRFPVHGPRRGGPTRQTPAR